MTTLLKTHNLICGDLPTFDIRKSDNELKLLTDLSKHFNDIGFYVLTNHNMTLPDYIKVRNRSFTNITTLRKIEDISNSKIHKRIAVLYGLRSRPIFKTVETRRGASNIELLISFFNKESNNFRVTTKDNISIIKYKNKVIDKVISSNSPDLVKEEFLRKATLL